MAALESTAGDLEPPFAVTYDPRTVAALADVDDPKAAPVKVHRTGEIEFAPQFHVFCAHCGARAYREACGCAEKRGQDCVFRGLPEPERTGGGAADPSRLLRRWICCVKMSPAMGTFAADAWFDEHGARTLRSLASRASPTAPPRFWPPPPSRPRRVAR